MNDLSQSLLSNATETRYPLAAASLQLYLPHLPPPRDHPPKIQPTLTPPREGAESVTTASSTRSSISEPVIEVEDPRSSAPETQNPREKGFEATMESSKRCDIDTKQCDIDNVVEPVMPRESRSLRPRRQRIHFTEVSLK
eukprot:Blabericola_migrator_1__8169@NODE_421_length_8666_cov_158_657053_g333_i0_p6_GENE_NODE_421_length_8666_cov_158_657053_g333_i0NODE_421_length_8666_cov_158_657053_g333_i0_p6_ORF_typecomplete_len140_score17_12_NODE_421_length_8666_cov_158_657053_g333_i055976016